MFLGDSVDSRLVGQNLRKSEIQRFWGIVWTAGRLPFQVLGVQIAFLGDSVDSRLRNHPPHLCQMISFWGIVWTAGPSIGREIFLVENVFGG